MSLELAQKLLAVFEECLPHVDEIHNTVSKWENKKRPPLLRSRESWRKCMEGNVEKLEQFEGLVHFLAEAMFGVDCDHDSVISMSFIDRSRYQHRHPPFKVPRLPDNPTLKQIMTARELAQTNAACAQEVLRHVEVELKFFMEDNKQLFEGDDGEG